MSIKARRVVRELVEVFMAHPDCLPDGWRERAGAPGSRATAETLRDYIAGMTDRYALVRWAGVTARACRAPPAVPPFAGPCETADGYCERFDLGEYASADAACLELGGAAAPFLFYRGSSPVDALPLRLTPASAGAMEAVYAGEPPVVRRVTRFLRTPAGLLASSAEIAAGGASFVVPRPTTPADAGALEAAAREDLAAIGLSGGEADAFVRAWGEELWGSPPPREAPPLLESYLVYWAPVASVDRMAELRFEPAPRRVVRAMAVRVDLTAAD
jgi:hypothetical protein